MENITIKQPLFCENGEALIAEDNSQLYTENLLGNINYVSIIINGIDARKRWGIITTVNTLNSLLTPAPMKEFPVFNSRLEDGSRIDTDNPKLQSRDLNLEIQMIADNPSQFYERHEAFCKELYKGSFDLSTSDRPDIVYHLKYNSCSAYTQFRRGIATLSLKVTEANPNNRTANE